MVEPVLVIDTDAGARNTAGRNEAPVPAVSWGAIWAGAAAATATSLILLMLGSGIGLASFSPWPDMGATAAAFGVGAAIWLIVVQWVSSALGGYLAGRLRTRWIGIRTDESFFRDTAHGIVTWAVGTVFVAALVIVTAAGVARTAADAASTVAGAAVEGVADMADPMAYFTDELFRSPTAPVEGDVRGETLRILTRGIAADTFPEDDRAYLGALIAAQTGLAPADAQARVNAVIADAQAAEVEIREAAEEAADAAAALAFYLFLSMLIGAFIAAVAAAIGGRQRDAGETVIG